MYHNYVLLCLDKRRGRRKFYTGLTEDLRQRLSQHKNKDIKTTKSFDEVRLVYCETCFNKTDARKRELQLKTGFGRGYLKRRIENYLIKSAGVV